MLCSEILNLHWQPRVGPERVLQVNLEEIWRGGALFGTDARIREFTALRFVGGACEFRGELIARTLVKGLGYFIEMRFHPDCTWSERKFRPRHFFNPLILLRNGIFKVEQDPTGSPPYGPWPADVARPAAASSEHAYRS